MPSSSEQPELSNQQMIDSLFMADDGMLGQFVAVYNPDLDATAAATMAAPCFYLSIPMFRDGVSGREQLTGTVLEGDKNMARLGRRQGFQGGEYQSSLRDFVPDLDELPSTDPHHSIASRFALKQTRMWTELFKHYGAETACRLDHSDRSVSWIIGNQQIITRQNYYSMAHDVLYEHILGAARVAISQGKGLFKVNNKHVRDDSYDAVLRMLRSYSGVSGRSLVRTEATALCLWPYRFVDYSLRDGMFPHHPEVMICRIEQLKALHPSLSSSLDVTEEVIRSVIKSPQREDATANIT